MRDARCREGSTPEKTGRRVEGPPGLKMGARYNPVTAENSAKS